MSICALFGSCVIDALDEQSVITIDIPGTFIQGIWPQDQHPGYLKFEGVMVEMLCQIEPSYHKYIIYRKIKGTKYKKKYIYARMIKAVYGTLLAAIIFYEKLSKHLREYSFVYNDYDMCTFNKMVNGNQLTM